MKRALLIFIKNPELGKVKTRLAEAIGNEEALEVYNRLLEITRKQTEKVMADKFLYYSSHIDTVDAWSNEYYHKRVQLQSADLGERMLNAFETSFNRGYKEVVIIGSDCPTITTEIIDDAFISLKGHDAVIGPAADGGFYLMGLRINEQTFFKHKEWSTKFVLDNIIVDFRRLKYNYKLLEVLNDIDNINDLQAQAF